MIVLFGIFLFAITHQAVISVEPTEWQKHQHGRFETLIKQWQEEIFETWSSSILHIQDGYHEQANTTVPQLTIWQQEQLDLLKSKFKAWTAGLTQQLLEQISNFEDDTRNTDCSESTLGLETLLDKLKKDFDQLHGNQHLNLDSQFSKFQRLKSRFEFLKSESGSEGASRCLERFRFYHNQYTSRIVTKEEEFARLFRDRVVDSLIRNMKTRNLADVTATLRQGTYDNTVLLERVADKLLRTESYYMQDNFEHIRWTVWNLAKLSSENTVLLTNAVLKKLEQLNRLESSYTLKLAHTVHHTSNRLTEFSIQIQHLFSTDVLCIKNSGSSAFIHESEPLIKPVFVEDTSTSTIRTVGMEIKMKRDRRYPDGLNVNEEECGWVAQSVRGNNYNDPVLFRFHRTVNDPERNWTLGSQADRVMLTSDGAYNINLDWDVSVVKTHSHQYGSGIAFKFCPSPASNTFSKFICHGRPHSRRYSYEAPLLLSREYAGSENANACTWTLTPCKDVRP